MGKDEIKDIVKAADYLRYLSLMAIEKASSGHPGLPLGCAELGVVLYRYILKYNPKDGNWLNRDRFVLSAGHGSMLLYALLYMSGYNYSIKDIENFRQMGSKTPGHPEYDPELGVETTTGPLGQGLANSVGLAIEEKMLQSRYNKDGFKLFDYNIITLMGDGCNMEGVSYEAASLAGHLGLDNLTAVYDSNKISIDGSTDITFTEDVKARYEAQGWYVESTDAEDVQDLHAKLDKLTAMREGKPKLLIMKSVIGKGVDKLKGSSKIHGAAAGLEEIEYFVRNSTVSELFVKEYGEKVLSDEGALMKLLKAKAAGEEDFIVDNETISFMAARTEEVEPEYNEWNTKLRDYAQQFKEESEQLNSLMAKLTPSSLKEKLLNYKEEKPAASRAISGNILNMCADEMPGIVGGSADLVGSTKATVKSSQYIAKGDFTGRNIAFGVREHAMSAVANGLALSGLLLPFSSTFFTFFDYLKPAMRLASLMKLPQLFVFTHDSLGVGEDGPTHQPIEHLNAMRLIPDMQVFRPGNDMETAFSYLYYIEKRVPTAVVCTRQKLSAKAFEIEQDRNTLYKNFCKGAYLFKESTGEGGADIILAASGSELGTALEAAEKLEADGKNVRVISIPSLELFASSEAAYKDALFEGGSVPVLLVEAAGHRAVEQFYAKNVHICAPDSFGHSAPAPEVFEKFSLTTEAVYNKAKGIL